MPLCIRALTASIRAYISLASGYRLRTFRHVPPRMNVAMLASAGSVAAATRAPTQASCFSGGSTHSVISR